MIYTPTEAHSWIFVTGGSFFARQMLAKKNAFLVAASTPGYTVRTKMSHWPDHVKKVYACMPDGYNAYYNGVFHCCEVGSLYGHPTAGRNWYMTLCKVPPHEVLYGYEQSAHDPCLFHKYEGDKTTSSTWSFTWTTSSLSRPRTPHFTMIGRSPAGPGTYYGPGPHWGTVRNKMSPGLGM